MCKRWKNCGIGFRYLVRFNQALPTKFGWKISLYTSCLPALILKAKYFPRNDFFKAVKGPQPSPIWLSLLWGTELLAKGVGWWVGDGNTVNTWVDNWIPSSTYFKTLLVYGWCFGLPTSSFFFKNGEKTWIFINLNNNFFRLILTELSIFHWLRPLEKIQSFGCRINGENFRLS